MYHVHVTFLLRSCGVSVTYLYFTFVCTAYQGVCATYVWRMYGVWSVRVTYLQRMHYVPFLSTAYLSRIRGVLIQMNPKWFCALRLILKPLSHIHVSAAYRSRIYENCDTPRSETYFVQARYVPRTWDVPATFLWRISYVSILVWNFSFVCTAYQGVCATYVWRMWRMKRTRDVSTTYVLRSIRICSVSVMYQLLFIAPTYSGVRYRSPNFRPSVNIYVEVWFSLYQW